MTALFTIWRDGTATSCGRSCYSAKHKACRCPICGGLNHGKGPEAAARITRRHADEWTEAAGPDAEIELGETVTQDPLFLIGDRMYVEFEDWNGVEVKVKPSPDKADRFALISVGDVSAKITAADAWEIRAGLTEWLAEIGADTP